MSNTFKKPTVKGLRRLLKDAGLYRPGTSGRLGGIGATRIWDYPDMVVVVPRAGTGSAEETERIVSLLTGEGFSARRSGTGPGTSGEFHVYVDKSSAPVE